jgi:hypothetical protein
VIRSVISQPDLVLFTTMHGIAKILDRHGAELRCRLALIEDACYKIYQPKVAKARCSRPGKALRRYFIRSGRILL